jgi:hypothetical protein
MGMVDVVVVETPWMSDEYQTSYFRDIWSAIDHLVDELNRANDYEYEGITALGESGDFEGAFHAFQTSNALDNVVANLKNLSDQKSRVKDRAPLYAGEDGDALLDERAQAILPGGKWLRDGSHIFDPLPMKYTPYVYEGYMDEQELEEYENA